MKKNKWTKYKNKSECICNSKNKCKCKCKLVMIAASHVHCTLCSQCSDVREGTKLENKGAKFVLAIM